MERMESHTEMEGIFPTVLHHVLVAADTGCLKGFTWQLFILIRHHVNTEWQVIYTCLLAPQIINPYFGIWNTTAKTRLGVWLVFAIAVSLKLVYLLYLGISGHPGGSAPGKKYFVVGHWLCTLRFAFNSFTPYNSELSSWQWKVQLNFWCTGNPRGFFITAPTNIF